MVDKWDLRFLELSKHVASWSKDPSTKVGAVIVNSIDKNPISMGFNGFPVKVSETSPERLERNEKLRWVVHAEANSIANCSKNNGNSKGCTMYVTYFPCSNCAGLIVNAGIARVVCENKPDFNHERWGESWKIAQTIFDEAGVKVEYIHEL
jgi:dCMP deaminase